jgi:membrane protease subunit HflK
MSDLDKMKHEPPRTTEQAAAGTTPPSPTGNPNPAVLEEAGSRALADALRSSFVIVKVLMVGLVVLFFFSGIFTVPSQERAIILRFGKPVGTLEDQLLGPGLHWSFPSPIDEVVRIPIGEIQSVTSSAGWYLVTPEEQASGQEQPGGFTLNPAIDGYTITSDGNIIHVSATIRYRITEPLNYVLNFVNASNVIKSAVDNALFYASSFYTADRAVRDDQLGFRETVLNRVRDRINEHKLGISIESGEVVVKPPKTVREFFAQVSIADVERRKAQDEAQAYASRILSMAQGEASAVVNQGRGDATRLLQQVSAEAAYFKDQLASYESNSELFQARLHAEAMGRILTNVQDRVFSLPLSREGRESEVRWQLNPAPRRRPNPSEPEGQPSGSIPQR